MSKDNDLPAFQVDAETLKQLKQISKYKHLSAEEVLQQLVRAEYNQLPISNNIDWHKESEESSHEDDTPADRGKPERPTWKEFFKTHTEKGHPDLESFNPRG